jgi:hypothetical protein
VFNGPSESAKEAVEQRIMLLQTVHEDAVSRQNIIVGRDEKDFCSKSEIFKIRQRAIFLCHAYQIAIEKMNNWTWHDCCKEACKHLNSLGLNQAKFFKTIATGTRSFGSLRALDIRTRTFDVENVPCRDFWKYSQIPRIRL